MANQRTILIKQATSEKIEEQIQKVFRSTGKYIDCIIVPSTFKGILTENEYKCIDAIIVFEIAI